MKQFEALDFVKQFLKAIHNHPTIDIYNYVFKPSPYKNRLKYTQVHPNKKYHPLMDVSIVPDNTRTYHQIEMKQNIMKSPESEFIYYKGTCDHCSTIFIAL